MADNKRLTEIKTAMLLHVPFFASLLLDMMEVKVGKFPGVFPPGNETAATNGKTIWIDEDFLDSMPLPEAVFVVCHEVGHAMWSHMSRAKKYMDTGFEGKPFDARLWNIAGDYVINDLLVESKIGKMPKVGLHDRSKGTSEDMVDDVYRKLLNDPDMNGQGAGGQGQGGFDIHIPDAGAANEAEWKRAVKTAADAAKAMGKLPDNLKRFVEQLLNPTIPWQEKLRHHVMKAIGRDSHTWSKPHRRRLITQGVVLPSYTGFAAGHVVVAVDTSGSVSEKELRVFMTELQNILDTARPTGVTVIACDADIHDVTELAQGDALQDNMPPLSGGGGTSFIPPFEWCKNEGLVPAALIYFTDMMGPFPEPVEYPTIWCATTDHEGPFGETIRVDIKEYDDDE